MWFSRKPKPDPIHVARDLRDRALGVEPATLGLSPTEDHAHVWGVLMETGYPGAVVTLVALADGTASLYFSSGGGVIGAGEHASVRKAVDGILTAAEAHLATFVTTATTPLPEIGRVRFYVRTFTGMLSGEAGEADLGYNRHPLSPVFHAGHCVITAVREASEPQ